jgi:hypothetical protein
MEKSKFKTDITHLHIGTFMYFASLWLTTFAANSATVLHFCRSGGELLELRLLDTQLLDTFGSKSIARHKFYQLLESS